MGEREIEREREGGREREREKAWDRTRERARDGVDNGQLSAKWEKNSEGESMRASERERETEREKRETVCVCVRERERERECMRESARERASKWTLDSSGDFRSLLSS